MSTITHLNGLGALRKTPPEQLKNIKSIYLRAPWFDSKDWPLLERCVNVEWLRTSTYYTPEVHKVSRLLKCFPKLHTLFCSGKLPKGVMTHTISKLHNLRILVLSNGMLRTLPANIANLKELQELHLNNNRFAKIPQQLSSLKQLKILNLLNNPISRVSKSIFLLVPQLDELYLAKSLLNNCSKITLGKLKKIPYLYSGNKAETQYAKRVHQMAWGILDSGLKKFDQQWRSKLLRLLGNIPVRLSPSELLELTNLKEIELLRLWALEMISKNFKQSGKPLQKGSKILFCGEISSNKRAAVRKAKLSKTDKVANATHLLVGKYPEEQLALLQKTALPILTEKDLIAYSNEVNEVYLRKDEETKVENIQSLSQLLLSGDEANQKLVFALFEEGGFPEELLTEIFLLYKFSKPKSIAKEKAKQLLWQYGSIKLRTVAERQLSLAKRSVNEQTLYKNIQKYSKDNELDPIKIAHYTYLKNGKGKLYLLRKLDSEAKLAFLESIVSPEGTLSLARVGLTSFPKEVLQIKSVRSLELQYNNFSKLPADLIKMNLKKLIIWGLGIPENEIKRLQKAMPDCKISN